MNYIIDCSFSASLFLPDEDSQAARSFLLQLKKHDTLFVPQLWWYETANVLLMAKVRNRFNQTTINKIFLLFQELNIQVDEFKGSAFIKSVSNLGVQYRISAYDATYLELAKRKKGTLCTLDRQLRKAAQEEGILIYG